MVARPRPARRDQTQWTGLPIATKRVSSEEARASSSSNLTLMSELSLPPRAHFGHRGRFKFDTEFNE